VKQQAADQVTERDQQMNLLDRETGSQPKIQTAQATTGNALLRSRDIVFRTLHPLRGLSRRGRALYRKVLDNYELAEHHERILLLLCESLDRADAAQAALDEHGLTMEDRFGQIKPRPEVAIKRDAEVSAARLLRELDLDASTIPDVRPPRIQGRYA
jgi:hypothetical protein